MNIIGSHKIDIFVLYAPELLSFFCKYRPDDGPLRLKLVANSNITKKYYIVVSD